MTWPILREDFNMNDVRDRIPLRSAEKRAPPAPLQSSIAMEIDRMTMAEFKQRDPADLLEIRRNDVAAPAREGGRTALQWTPPRGYPDMAPSRFDRIEGDGYLTLDAPWLVPALLRSVPEMSGRILEPAAGRGHISLELRRAGFDVVSRDIRRYLVPLVDGIGVGDIRELDSLAGFDWVVTNLRYRDLTELTAHLTRLGARDRCGVALLVRAEWLIPKARHRLVHEHPHFAGAVTLTARPRWFERGDDDAGPRHNFAWAVWSGAPRVGDPWLRFAGKPEPKPMQLTLFQERTGPDAARKARIGGADLRRQEARRRVSSLDSSAKASPST